ncbi:MAG: hypothetical protein JWP00_2025 [Chloroflexi bacterium]|nr:hypothetical protein [Chloroflexota bacterium]
MAASYKDLRELLAYVEKRGQLRRIPVEVSPEYELAEVTSRAARLPDGGPVLLFQKVRGSRLPVLTNLLGSTQRLAWSFGLNNLAELEQVTQKLLRPPGPQDLGERLARLAETSHLARFAPRSLRSGPAQEVVRLGTGFDLVEGLPFFKSGTGESGASWRFLQLFNRPRPDGEVEIRSGTLVEQDGTLYLGGIELQPGERRQVSLVVGGDPSLLFAANAPFMPELDPLIMAGFLANRRLELVRCKTNDLEVPAVAELVLEGLAEADNERPDVRLGQINGFYAAPSGFVRFTPTALTSRKDPLLVTSLISAPPNEAGVLARGTERILLPILRQTAPEITDLLLPAAGAFYNLAIVSIKKTYPGQAQRVMYNLWGQPQLKYLKHLLVVDEDCPLQPPDRLIGQVLALLDPDADLLSIKGPLDFSDIMPVQSGFGTKFGLDATRKLPGEVRPEINLDRRNPLRSPDAVQKLVTHKWLEYGIE